MILIVLALISLLFIGCTKEGFPNISVQDGNTTSTADQDDNTSDPVVGEFLSPNAIWKWMQEPTYWCYNYRQSDQTCNNAGYVSKIDKSSATYWGISLVSSGNQKFTYSQQLFLTDDGICHTLTEAYYNTYYWYNTTDSIAKITPDDDVVGEDGRRSGVARAIDTNQQTIGTTTCYKYKVISLSPENAITALEEIAYIDGVRQPSKKVEVIFYPREAELKLHIPD